MSLQARPALAFVFALSCIPTRAFAQAREDSAPQNAATRAPSDELNDDPSEEARKLYRDASQAFAQSRFEDARNLLLRVWAIRKTCDVATALGQAELSLNAPRDAAEHLDFAVRNFPPQASAEFLQRVRDALARATAQVATLELAVSRDGATVRVDGQAIGTAPLSAPVFLAPGDHLIEATLETERASQQVSAAAGARQSLRLVLQAPTESPPRGQSSAKHPSIVPLVAGGVLTLAAAGSGLGFALAANNRDDRANELRSQIPGDACASSGAFDAMCSELRRTAHDHDRERTISNVSFIISATALAGTAAYWFFTRRTEPKGFDGSRPSLKIDATIARGSGSLLFQGTW